jgi:hypothetical protein
LSLKHFGFLKERLVFLLRLPWKDGLTPILQLAFEKKCYWRFLFDASLVFLLRGFRLHLFSWNTKKHSSRHRGYPRRSEELQVGSCPSHWSSELRSTLVYMVPACEPCWARSLLQILRILIAKNFQWPY